MCLYAWKINKQSIEALFGDKLDRYSSRETSTAKSIIYKRVAEIFNPNEQEELYAWMIEKYGALRKALVSAGGPIEKCVMMRQNGS